MSLVPLFDLGWFAILFIFGLSTLITAIPLTIISEAVVLQFFIFQGNKFWRSIQDSVIINLLSGLIGWLLIGYAIPLLEPNFLEWTGWGLDSMNYYKRPPEAEVWTFVGKVLFVSWAASVVIEGVILTSLEKSQAPLYAIWLASLVANLASYIGLGAIGWGFTKGWAKSGILIMLVLSLAVLSISVGLRRLTKLYPREKD